DTAGCCLGRPQGNPLEQLQQSTRIQEPPERDAGGHVLVPPNPGTLLAKHRVRPIAEVDRAQPMPQIELERASYQGAGANQLRIPKLLCQPRRELEHGVGSLASLFAAGMSCDVCGCDAQRLGDSGWFSKIEREQGGPCLKIAGPNHVGETETSRNGLTN